MKAIERHRQTWQGKSDEWLFERIDNELKQKVEEIHRLLSENEALRQFDVIRRFIEKLGVKHNIDEKYIMISYDKKDGTLDVWKQTNGSSILLEQILINDL